jgi:riboflavin synthase
MKKFKKKILFEINHFSIKNFSSQLITNDLMTNQTIFAVTLHSRSAQ